MLGLLRGFFDGELTVAGCQVPTKASLTTPLIK